jgi:hypothetical protein
LISVLAASAAVLLGYGAAPASAHPCVIKLSVVFIQAPGNHLCGEDVLPEEEEIDQSEIVDTTDAQADPVGPATSTFTYSSNLTPVGFSERLIAGTGLTGINSDLGFQGDYAYQGTYFGFRILDISDPASPQQILNYQGCGTNGQGDVLVYGNLLIRSYDAPSNSTATCGGQVMGNGFEGVHIFDISNKTNPVLVRQIRMAATGSGPVVPGGTFTSGCGSHTATLVPDPARGNLYVYSSASSASCTGLDIIRIPLDNPAGAGLVRRAPAGRQCHDTGVFLANVNLAACAGGNGFSVLSFNPALPPNSVGGLENPTLLYSRQMPIGSGPAHSHSFSYDGQVLIFGWEPGGGTSAQCQASSTLANRTLFFHDPTTGAELGRYVQPRPQTSAENCTWHNFNVVPTNRGRIGVIGSYQMGITVIDFTDPANVKQIAFADPAPLVPTATGGDWSSYWYNGNIYESDIRRGVLIWDLHERVVQGAREFELSNPQTQDVLIPLDKTGPSVEATLTTAGQPGWYRAPVVTLSADDGPAALGSDIWSVQYRLDAGEWTSYADPFAVTGDGQHTLDYRAEDGAGNVTEKSLTFNVDSVAPEAAVGFDATSRQVLVTGSDALSGLADAPAATGAAAASTRTYTIADRAGNTLTLVANVTDVSGNETRVQVVSTSYNGAAAQAAAPNSTKFTWQVDRKGELAELAQLIKVQYGTGKNAVDVSREANYHGGTSPVTNVKSRQGSTETRSTHAGLLLISLATANGDLAIAP